MSESTFTVTGMTCMGCVGSVKRLLSQLPGVADVQIDLGSGRVHVVHDEKQTGMETLKQAIFDGGYQVTG